jgi:hypothetical protein
MLQQGVQHEVQQKFADLVRHRNNITFSINILNPASFWAALGINTSFKPRIGKVIENEPKIAFFA